MGFPFLSPLNPWVTEVMEQREKKPIFSSFNNIYAVLTSGALVVKSTVPKTDDERVQTLSKILDPTTRQGATTGTVWEGCIIANNVNNIDLSYSKDKTPVGIDFNGKVIYVDGEKGRKVSTPIIESFDIDTDGANNTLKTARVNVICFTLKQFEMFEQFFLKPGMYILLEWGDISMLKRGLTGVAGLDPTDQRALKRTLDTYKDGQPFKRQIFTNPNECLIPKKNFKDFCEGFSKYFRSDISAITDYRIKVEQSLGSYDLVAGKLTDYSFSVNEDGTYAVQMEFSQGNQISLAIPHSGKKSSSSDSSAPKTEIISYDQIKNLMAIDFNIEINKLNDLMAKEHPEKDSGKTWEHELFNFLKVNKEQKDTVYSDKAYISLRFILSILMNYVIADGNVDKNFFQFDLPEYMVGGKKKKILPVTSSKRIMSSSDEIIFPTDSLPIPIAPNKDSEENQIILEKKGDVYSGKDGTINGYNFNTTEPITILTDGTGKNSKDTIEVKDGVVGNGLNIFLKYENVVKAWKTNGTRIDFLEKILDTINKNGYGLFTLMYGCLESPGKPTVLDIQLTGGTEEKVKTAKEQNDKTLYRFKPTTINSIVRQFSFNFEMSNLMAGRQFFNSGKLLSIAKAENSKKKVNEQNNGTLPLPPQFYKSIDNSTYANADGWWSINNVEYVRVNDNYKEIQDTKSDAGKKNASSDPDPELSKKEKPDFGEIIKNKSVTFLMKPNGKDTKSLIYKDKDLITTAVLSTETQKERKKSILSPVDVTIEIDGFSGFTCGQYFLVTGVPEIYNQNGVFQITNIKHNVSNDGWATTIEASHRIIK